MISKDLNDVASLGEIMAILGKGVDDGVEFLVVDVPILFSSMELMVKKEKGVPSVVVFLLEYASVGFIGRVGGEPNGLSWLKGANINVIADVGEDSVESRLMLGGPFPGLILLGEIGKASCGVRVVGYKFVVKSHHTQEGAEVGKAAWGREVTDTLDFVGCHTNAFATDDVES